MGKVLIPELRIQIFVSSFSVFRGNSKRKIFQGRMIILCVDTLGRTETRSDSSLHGDSPWAWEHRMWQSSAVRNSDIKWKIFSAKDVRFRSKSATANFLPLLETSCRLRSFAWNLEVLRKTSEEKVFLQFLELAESWRFSKDRVRSGHSDCPPYQISICLNIPTWSCPHKLRRAIRNDFVNKLQRAKL